MKVRGTGLDAGGAGLEVRGAGLEARGTGLEVRGTGLEARGAGLEVTETGLEARGAAMEARGTGLEAKGAAMEVNGRNLNVKGVNLGNWLVLEKWMGPAMFEGTTAEDEYHLPLQLSREVYEARIAMHRAEYISERDFVSIKAMGFDTVRIPVPYFVFGDREPFIGCVKELDLAFQWGERYGLQILLDLHTAPLGQNGFDNGGICGVCKWSKNPREVEYVLEVLEKLAKRYGKRDGLWGIEVLNEPITERTWNLFDVPNRYPAADLEMAEGSGPIPMEFLRRFYLEAYDRIRRYLPENRYVVIHDGFELTAWKDFMRDKKYVNVVLDTHQYLMMAESMGCEQTAKAYVSYIHQHYSRDIEEMQCYFPVICGEWCLFNSAACGCDTKGGQSVLNGVNGENRRSMDEEEKRSIYREVAKAQLEAWDKGSGYFYWSYKLLTDTVTDPAWAGWDSWDLGRCVDFGWFPKGGKA